MKTYNYIVVLATVLLGIIVSCRKDDSVQSNKKLTSDMTTLLKEANIFTPNLEPKQKKQLLQKLIEIKEVLRKNSNTKCEEDFEDESVAMTRWLLETTLNNELSNLYDSSFNEFYKDTLHYQFQITGFNASGEPMLSGSDITSVYINLCSKVLEINENPDSSFYLSFIQLESLDNLSTNFQVVLSIAKKIVNSASLLKSQPHVPWVLSPSQTPVPFGPNESYSPMPFRDHPSWTWAGREIDKKLNAKKSLLNYPSGDYIIENVMPCPFGGYTDYPWGNDTFWWRRYYSTDYLTSAQLNLYLTNYKGVLDYWNSPYGLDNIYASEYITSATDTYYDWTYPSNEQGFGPQQAHYFHNYVIWLIRYICVGPAS